MASKLDSAELKDILRLLKSGLLASDEKISALFGLHNDDEKLSALLGLDDDDFDHKIDFDPLHDLELDDMFEDIDDLDAELESMCNFGLDEELESMCNFGDLLSNIDAFEAEMQLLRCPTFPF